MPSKITIKRSYYLPLIIGSFFFAYYPVLKSLWGVWSNSDEYSHGFFIIPLAILICWQKKDTLNKIHLKPSPTGFILFALSILAYIGAEFAGITTVTSVSLVTSTAGIVLYLCGWKMLKELIFPLFLLFFMIPIPAQIFSSLTISLQLFVSQISVSLASFLNIPIFRNGNVISLPGRTIEVVQACSGLRSLISLTTLSLVLGYYTLTSNTLRSLLFISALPIAILINIIRISVIIIMLYYFQYDLTAESIHKIYGILIFTLALALMFSIQKILQIWDNQRI